MNLVTASQLIFAKLSTFAAGIIPPGEVQNLPNSNPNGVAEAIRLASVVAGVIAVIVIIIAGIQFSLSGGDSSKVATARNAIIYALVGLVICILAGTITTFVISEAAR